MKRLIVLIIAIALTLTFVACTSESSNTISPEENNSSAQSSPATSEEPKETAQTTPVVSEEPEETAQVTPAVSEEPEETPPTTPAVSEEPEVQMSSEELEAALLEQPLYVTKTNYVVQDDRLKNLYPDALQAIVMNNSEVDIKNLYIAFVAWDKNKLPVKIVAQYDFDGGSYIVITRFKDANLVPGETFGEGRGCMLDSDTDNIAFFKAIVASYEDFDGNTWENPYYDTWVDMYEDKKLTE